MATLLSGTLQVIDLLITFLFWGGLLLLNFFVLNRIYILWLYRRFRKNNLIFKPKNFYENYPKVTIQLPIFNEAAVVTRLINSVCAIDYPKDKLQIQVLDDSTDQQLRDMTLALCQQKKQQGVNIEYIYRSDRIGYKAGALQNGLTTATGELIAIFDADFLPPADFLQKTIHYFTDENIGWVQSSWTHLNEHHSLLTQCTALYADCMFHVEDIARNHANRWSVFHGTAGVLRRSMIEDAGGWHWDTITEDGDLSYRALVKGWKYISLSDIPCPCEAPPTLTALVSQQARWAKGNVQTIKKLFTKMLTANIRFSDKYEFVIFMSNYLVCPIFILMSILILPYFLIHHPNSLEFSFTTSVFMIIQGCAVILVGYLIYFFSLHLPQKTQGRSSLYTLPRCFFTLVLFVGLAPFIANALWEGIINKNTEFIRTPKYNLTDKSETILNLSLNSTKKNSKIAMIEILLGLYNLFSIIICSYVNLAASFKFLPTLILFTCTYLYFGFVLLFPQQKFRWNFLEKHKQLNKNKLTT